jgi:hypothetical protein
MTETPRPDMTRVLAILPRLGGNLSDGAEIQGFRTLPSGKIPMQPISDRRVGFTTLGVKETQNTGFATLSPSSAISVPSGEQGGAPDAQGTGTNVGKPAGQERRNGRSVIGAHTDSQSDGGQEPREDGNQHHASSFSGEQESGRVGDATAASGMGKPPGGRDGTDKTGFEEPEPGNHEDPESAGLNRPEDHIDEILQRYGAEEPILSFAIIKSKENLLAAGGMDGQNVARRAVAYLGYRNQAHMHTVSKQQELVSWGVGDTMGLAFSDLGRNYMQITQSALHLAEGGDYLGLISFFETEGRRMVQEESESLRTTGEAYINLAATLPSHGEPLIRPTSALTDPEIRREYQKTHNKQ